MQGDVVIVGGGFGGSLTGLILSRLGLKVILVDRGQHPRFAIGESSTPVANLIWAKLCQDYGLVRLAPLGEYGSWQAKYPQLACGLKRGFSYFYHSPQTRFQPSWQHERELLVSASFGDIDADTHWYRAEFDQLINQEAVREGVTYFDQTELTEIQHGSTWKLTGTRLGEPIYIDAGFAIDATGEGGFLPRFLKLPNRVHEMGTNSRALFAHFENLPRWHDIQRPSQGVSHPFDEHPYPCDDAAVHHLFEGGWMWVLRFNNGITSAGFALDQRLFPLDPRLSPCDEWNMLLERYPSIGDHLGSARIQFPKNGLIRTSRIQRWVGQATGPNWALLPTAAGFLDPLHSTGNAHTLSGIERLIPAFQRYGTNWMSPGFQNALQSYGDILQTEIRHIDQIIHGCYLGLRRFELAASFSMFYFTAAIWSEHQRRQRLWCPKDGFLGSTDENYLELLRLSYDEMRHLTNQSKMTDQDVQGFVHQLRQRIAPYNLAKLIDPDRKNLYPYPEDCKPISE